MASELIAVVAIVGALTGASLNAIRAWYQAPEDVKFSWKNFGGGLLASMLPALAVVNFVNLESQAALGLVSLFVSQALAGAGASTLMSQAHQPAKKV